MHHGLDPEALAALEVGFHAGSIIAFAVLLWALLPLSAPRTTPTQAERNTSPAH